jgi:hypothetical protein
MRLTPKIDSNPFGIPHNAPIPARRGMCIPYKLPDKYFDMIKKGRRDGIADCIHTCMPLRTPSFAVSVSKIRAANTIIAIVPFI